MKAVPQKFTVGVPTYKVINNRYFSNKGISSIYLKADNAIQQTSIITETLNGALFRQDPAWTPPATIDAQESWIDTVRKLGHGHYVEGDIVYKSLVPMSAPYTRDDFYDTTKWIEEGAVFIKDYLARGDLGAQLPNFFQQDIVIFFIAEEFNNIGTRDEFLYIGGIVAGEIEIRKRYREVGGTGSSYLIVADEQQVIRSGEDVPNNLMLVVRGKTDTAEVIHENGKNWQHVGFTVTIKKGTGTTTRYTTDNPSISSVFTGDVFEVGNSERGTAWQHSVQISTKNKSVMLKQHTDKIITTLNGSVKPTMPYNKLRNMLDATIGELCIVHTGAGVPDGCSEVGGTDIAREFDCAAGFLQATTNYDYDWAYKMRYNFTTVPREADNYFYKGR